MATPGLLLQSQTNDVFIAVKAFGFDPSTFAWELRKSASGSGAVISALIHKPSDYWFRFDMGDEGHLCQFSPGDDTIEESNYPGNWRMQLDYVHNWLSYLKRETQSPDLWAMLSEGNTLSAAASLEVSGENTPFTASERTRIEASLGEIRSLLIASESVTTEKLAEIDAKLEYLEHASERLGRKDWLNVAFSVVTNIILTAAASPENARNILHVAGTVLSWVLGGTPLLPGGLH
jgi:hypothetical protein